MEYGTLYLPPRPKINKITGRLLPNHIPWNKGKKYKSPKNPTKFQKGSLPWNHRPVGSIRFNSEGYYEIKISEPRKWMHLHRYIWQQHHGPIPKGMYCRIKPGANRHNLGINDLELITMAENLNRNLNRKTAGKSIAKTQRIKRIKADVSKYYGVNFSH